MTSNGRITLKTAQDAPQSTQRTRYADSPVSYITQQRAGDLPTIARQMAVDIDAVLEQEHWLYEREYQRQTRLWATRVGRMPHYHYEWASVAEDTNVSIQRAAQIVSNWSETK